MKFISDTLTILIQLGILGIVVAILLKLYPNMLRQPQPQVQGSKFKVQREEVGEEGEETPADEKAPKPFWDDENQLAAALESGATDFADRGATHLNDLPPLDRQREISDRILELKERRK